MAEFKKLFRNSVALFALEGVNVLVPLALIPYLIRGLGVDQYGQFAMAQALAGFFVIVVDYGFNYTATEIIARAKANRMDLTPIFWSVWGAQGLLLVAGLAAYAALVAFLSSSQGSWSLYLSFYGVVIGQFLFPNWLFQGVETMGRIAVATFGGKILTAVLIFAFVTSPQGLTIAAASMAAGAIFSGFISLCFVSKIVSLRAPVIDFSLIWAQIREGRAVFFSTVCVTSYTSTSPFILGLVASPSAVTLYAATEKVVRAVNKLVQPISGAIFPHVASLQTNGNRDAMRFVRNYLKYLVPVAMCISLVVWYFAGTLVSLVVGFHSEEGTQALRAMAFLPLVINVSMVLSLHVMLISGMKREFATTSFMAAIVSVSLTLLLGYTLGAIGGSIGLMIAETSVFLLIIYFLHRGGLLVQLADRS